MNPLLDIDFINELSINNQREIFAKVTALNKQEHPIEAIEGKISDGNVNIDGKSLIRRTCNLTLVAEDVNINEFYWGLRNKFTLELGLKNTINSNYPDIIWFKMGTYVITQFNTTLTANKWTIKIQGKDKMCLLNGEVSGNLIAETDFSTEEYHDLENDIVTYTDIPIKLIIQNIVNVFGGELLQNIIINDLEDSGLILLEYLNDNPAYLYRKVDTNEYKNIILDGSIECYYQFKKILTRDEYLNIPQEYIYLTELYNVVEQDKNVYYEYNDKTNTEFQEHIYRESNDLWWFLGKLEDSHIIVYDILQQDLDFIPEASIIKFPVITKNNEGKIISKKPSEDSYVLAKIETGEVPGYFYTDLTYANGEKKLIGKAGEALTSVLNKIKDMLVHFEYFYDVNGKFVFQKKSDYVTTPWNSLDTNDMELYSNSRLDSSNIMFSFLDNKLVTSFQNNPKLTNVKNDFTTWGSYKINDIEIPIHMRYAIDVKPKQYKPIRPLMERIETVLTTKDGTIISENISYKYNDESYPHVIGSLIDFQIDDKNEGYIQECTNVFNQLIPQLTHLQSVFPSEIQPINIKEYYIDYKDRNKTEKWDLLYNALYDTLVLNKNKVDIDVNKEFLWNNFNTAITIKWHKEGSFNNNLYCRELYKLKEGEEYNNFKITKLSIPLENGYIQTTTTIPYFMAKPIYSELREEVYDYNASVPNPNYVNGSSVPGESNEYIRLKDYKQEFEDQNLYSNFDDYLKNSVSTEIYEAFVIKYQYPIVDWRELIYQMSLDYSKCHTFEDFYYYIAQTNPEFPSGITGYEQYYIDLQSFWRELYNPNPELNYELIPFSNVKKLSLLLDDDENNDVYDNIYVAGGYERITKNNILNIELTPYNLCTMVKTDDRINGPYPFITGEECHLFFEVPYYINIEGAMKKYQSLRKNDTDYKELNKIALNNIFIRDNQSFTTLVEEKGEDKTYQPFTSFDREIDEDERYKQFMVLRYPATETFDRYESDYFKFVDVQFENLIKQASWYDEKEYYYKPQNTYKKLKEIFDLDKKFKDIYYGPSINLIKSHADILKLQLNKMDIEEYPTNNKIKFLSDHCTYIQDFLLAASQYNFVDLDDTLNKEMQEVLNNHELYLEGFITGFIDGYYDFLQPEYACLNQILTTLLSTIKRTIQNYNNLLENNYTNKSILIKKIYELLINAEKEISLKYDEVKNIKDIITEIKKKELTLENIDSVLQTYLDNLNQKISTAYAGGQVELTIKNIKSIKNLIKDSTANEIDDILQQIEFFIQYPVTLMKTFVDNFYSEENGLISTLTNTTYLEFNKLINTIINVSSDIDLLLRGNYDKADYIVKAMCFERENGLLTPILNRLYELLMKDAKKSELEKYYIDTSSFQEFILLDELDNFGNLTGKLSQEKIEYYLGSHNYNTDSSVGNYWNKTVYETPQLLTFWFDFLDANQNELAKISVPAIGQRTKVITDKNVKAIAYTDIPQVIFKKPTDDYEVKSGYTYININNNTEGFFRTSARSKSAKERIDELLYNHSYGTEAITISSVPIYHLEPNHHIYVRDDKSHIDGEYIVNKITIPLSFKKTMNITATKVAPYLN